MINYIDIDLNKTYWRACIGIITEIQISSISPPYISYKNVGSDFVSKNNFLSDMGIYHPENSYTNSLNRVFKTYEEAKKWTETSEYKGRLNDHFCDCDLLDSLSIDCYDDYDYNC